LPYVTRPSTTLAPTSENELSFISPIGVGCACIRWVANRSSVISIQTLSFPSPRMRNRPLSSVLTAGISGLAYGGGSVAVTVSSVTPRPATKIGRTFAMAPGWP
jgi:hypothetical protein